MEGRARALCREYRTRAAVTSSTTTSWMAILDSRSTSARVPGVRWGSLTRHDRLNTCGGHHTCASGRGTSVFRACDTRT